MKQLVEQLVKLGYNLMYEYNPIEQQIYYTVMCGDRMIDMGLADEITFEGILQDIVGNCIYC